MLLEKPFLILYQQCDVTQVECLWKIVVTSNLLFLHHHRDRRLQWSPVCRFILCGYILTGTAVSNSATASAKTNLVSRAELCGDPAVRLVRYLSYSVAG